MNNVQPIWGDQFIKKISNCYMGLNLSRGKPIKYYSSDRIAQLIGNGLLTLIDKKTFGMIRKSSLRQLINTAFSFQNIFLEKNTAFVNVVAFTWKIGSNCYDAMSAALLVR